MERRSLLRYPLGVLVQVRLFGHIYLRQEFPLRCAANSQADSTRSITDKLLPFSDQAPLLRVAGAKSTAGS